MADDELKTGDVVRLKSGGPRMTVSAIDRSEDGTPRYVTCVWFSGDGFETSNFCYDTLILAINVPRPERPTRLKRKRWEAGR